MVVMDTSGWASRTSCRAFSATSVALTSDALGAVYANGHGVQPVGAGEGARFFIGVDHIAKLAEPDRGARRQRDGGIGQLLHGGLIAERADRLFAVADFGAARAEVVKHLTHTETHHCPGSLSKLRQWEIGRFVAWLNSATKLFTTQTG